MRNPNRRSATRRARHDLAIDHDALALAAQSLEPLSPTATRLSQLFASEEWQVADVIEIVSFDAPLTARILICANSALNAGSAGNVATIDDAITRIGSRAVVRIAVGVAVRRTMSVAIPELGASEGDLWRHDVAAAVVTEMIPLVTRRSIPPEAFTASLLHDIGRVIMYQQVDASTMRLVETAIEAGETAVAAERDIFGVDHGEIGALVAQTWGLPNSLVQAIRLHEEPAEAQDHHMREICDIVKVSDAGARKMGFQCGEQIEDIDDLSSSFARLGLDSEKFDEVCTLSLERYEEVLAQFA